MHSGGEKAENSIPAIVSREVWGLSAVECECRKRYCKEHSLTLYRTGSEEYPLSMRVVCGTCGRTFMLLESGAMDDSGRRYWRCTSFHGKKGTPIKGRRFTQKGQPLRQNIDETKSHVRYRRAHRQLPEPRQMLCTDIEIGADKPEKAFVLAWNLLVSKMQMYQAPLKRTMQTTDDMLLRTGPRSYAGS